MLLGVTEVNRYLKLVQEIFTKIFLNQEIICAPLFIIIWIYVINYFRIERIITHKRHNDIKIDNVVVWIRPRGEFIQGFRDKQYAPGRWNRCGVDGLKLIDFGQ